MKAMQLAARRTALTLVDVPTPRPGRGQLLIKVGACGVCRTDLHVVDGELAQGKLPIVPGHEIVGTVAEKGAGVRVYDISDPFRPEEIAAFLPETPAGQRGCRISDLFVDDRSIIYAADRARGGLYVLEYTGKRPLN
ncbi:MAG: alcohol dehydrogenase catalytic domain-containing protein [Burkholderiales bacterium]